jgi:hypothetical protein
MGEHQHHQHQHQGRVYLFLYRRDPQLKPPYNVQHRHSGIALLTPEDVHLGRVVERRKARQSVLLKAWQAHPERFVRGTPRPPELEPITYINRSEEGEAA